MISKKVTRGWKLNLDPVEFTDAPTSYLQDASQVKGEERGQYKLRARNDKIYSELADLASESRNKVSVQKSGNRIFYIVHGLGITVSLING